MSNTWTVAVFVVLMLVVFVAVPSAATTATDGPVGGPEGVDTTLTDMPSVALSVAAGEHPDRLLFALSETFLRGRIVDKTATDLRVVFESAASSKVPVEIGLFSDVTVRLENIEVIKEYETEWVGQPGIAWVADVYDLTGNSGGREGQPPGTATMASALDAMSMSIRTQSGDFYRMSALTESGGRMQIGQPDQAQLVAEDVEVFATDRSTDIAPTTESRAATWPLVLMTIILIVASFIVIRLWRKKLTL